jgi:hypothetical protein
MEPEGLVPNSQQLSTELIIIIIIIDSSNALSLELGHFYSSLILYKVGRTPWFRDHSVARPLPTYRTTKTRNMHSQISMPRKEFELTTPVFDGEKSVHALDCAATEIDIE